MNSYQCSPSSFISDSDRESETPHAENGELGPSSIS